MTSVAEPVAGLGEDSTFRDLLDALPAAVYMTDAAGRVTFFNKAAENLAGRTPRLGEDLWCVCWRLYDAEGAPLPLEQCPMAVSIEEGRPIRNFEVIAERPDGTRVPLMPFPTPLRDANGRITGAVNMLVEIGAWKRAEGAAARRADEQAALYRFTDRLYRAESLEAVYEAALDAILAGLRCSRASILLFDEAGVMQFVAARGLSAAYRAAVAGHTPWKPGDTSAQPICIDDVAAADLGDELKAVIAGEGIAALGFVPIVANGGVIGKFMTYFDAPHAFSDEEIELSLTIARQLGFSIERARAEAALRASEARYRAVVESQAEMVCRFDADGRILFVNEPYARARATTADALIGRDFWSFIAEADRASVRRMLDRLTPDAPQVRIENRFVTAEGERWTLWTNHALVFDRDGRWREAQSTGIDISDRKQMEEKLRRSHSEFRALADNIHQLAWMTDAAGWIYWYNKRWFDYTGTTLEEMQGWGWTKAHHPEHVERVRRKFAAHIEAGEPWEDTFPLRGKDGEYRWFLSRALPIRDEQGAVVRWFGTNTDITERLLAEEQRTLLINELNHRVKNTLATVQSLAMQTLRNTERSEDARMLFDSRLSALARAHDILTAQNWKGASLADVVERALAPFRTDAARISAQGPEVRVTTKQALALSIALHELATNAAKYGALSTDAGRVELAWSRSDDGGLDELLLIWSETGGPRVKTPRRTGFGTRLIEQGLARELGGSARIEYRPGGVVATMSSPVAGEVGPPGSW